MLNGIRKKNHDTESTLEIQVIQSSYFKSVGRKGNYSGHISNKLLLYIIILGFGTTYVIGVFE